MKKSLIVFAIIIALTAVCTVSGALMLISGGFEPKKIVNTFTNNINVNKVDISQTESIPADGIRKIELENIALKINISESEGQNIEISVNGEIASFDNKPSLDIKKNNGELEISLNNDKSLDSFINLSPVSQTGKLTLLIPKAFNGGISIEESASEVNCELSQTDIESIEISDAAGNCKITAGNTNKSIDRISFSDCVGEIFFAGYAKNVVCDDTLGNSDIELYNVFDRITVKDILGNLTIRIPSDTKGEIRNNGSLGNVDSDFPINSAINGGGNSIIDIKDSLGNIKIISVSHD